MSVTFVARFDAELLAYVTLALRRQAELYDRNGRTPPKGIEQLFETLVIGASEGQSGTTIPARQQPVQVGHVSARLVTYDTAATTLACSVRQVKRLIAAGALPTVNVLGAKRIALDDIDTFISANRAGIAGEQEIA